MQNHKRKLKTSRILNGVFFFIVYTVYTLKLWSRDWQVFFSTWNQSQSPPELTTTHGCRGCCSSVMLYFPSAHNRDFDGTSQSHLVHEQWTNLSSCLTESVLTCKSESVFRVTVNIRTCVTLIFVITCWCIFAMHAGTSLLRIVTKQHSS